MREAVPKAVQDCHDLLRWLLPHLDKFPRARRFTLGERLEVGLLDVLAELIDAAYRRDKTPALRRANRRLQVVRHLWRLCYELEVVPARSANRNRNDTDNRNNNLGFRLAQSTRASPEPARPWMRRARRAGVHESPLPVLARKGATNSGASDGGRRGW